MNSVTRFTVFAALSVYMRPQVANARKAISFVALCFLLGAATLSVRAQAETARAAGTNRYNVLFIAIDDLRPSLGCYGDTYADSPNLDQFAKEGLLFSRHYVQVPTCGASRYALLTGCSPANSGVTHNNEALYKGPSRLSQKTLPGAQSMPELFRRSGYRTVCLGKISHTPDGRVLAYNGEGDGRPEVPHGWDALPTPFGPWERGWGAFFAYRGGRHRESGQGHKDLMEFTAIKDNELPDGMLADEAVTQLKDLAARDQPFFLGVGFFKPHLPFVATKADWEAVRKDELPQAEGRARPSSHHWGRSSEFYKYDLPFEDTRPLSDDAQRQSRAAYRACVRYVDRQVGKVLSTLRELSLENDTVVVIWGDHGWHLGEQQMWGKHSPWERAVHSVLLLKAPGLNSPGRRCDALVETIDIYPTLVELCQPTMTKTHKPLDGISLMPLLKNESTDIKPAAISWWGDGVSVRTANHRLMYSRKAQNPTPPELYAMDTIQGPDSQDNIAAQNPALVQQLWQLGEERSKKLQEISSKK